MPHDCHAEHVACEHHDGKRESLYPFIDTTKLRVLNATDPTAAGNPFKPFHARHDRSLSLQSNEDDPELILYIPFTQAVDIKSICIGGGENGHHPKQLKLFCNREDIDFANASELCAAQTLELVEDFEMEIEYPLQARKFQSVSSVTLYVQESFGGEYSMIYYVGFKGENKKWRHGIVDCVYESRALTSDQKIDAMHIPSTVS